MKYLAIFLKGIFAGVCVAMGATVYLSLLPDHKMLGAFLFAIGLFLIFTYGFSLYTGKIGFLVEKGASFVPELCVTWLGNFAGAAAVGVLLRTCARAQLAAAWQEKAASLCEIKLADPASANFVLALFCGILMFVAADTYQKAENAVGKYLAAFLPVAVFILSGFEHCVANMVYFSLAGIFSWKMLLTLLITTLGNSVGAFLVPLARKFYAKYS